MKPAPNKFPGSETAEYLANIAGMMESQKRGRRFSGAAELLVHPGSHARRWTDADVADSGLVAEMLGNPSLCRFKSCFNNAALAALMYPEVKYVEGFAASGGPVPFPVEHAWNVLPDGTIIDCTWCSHGAQQIGREYIGFIVPDEIVRGWQQDGVAVGLFNWQKPDELLEYLTEPPAWMWSSTSNTTGVRYQDVQAALVPRKRVLLDRPTRTPRLQLPPELAIKAVITLQGELRIHSGAAEAMGETAYQIVVASLYLDLVAMVRRLGAGWIASIPPETAAGSSPETSGRLLDAFDENLNVLEEYGQLLALELGEPPEVPAEVDEALQSLRDTFWQTDLAEAEVFAPEWAPDWLVEQLTPRDPWTPARRRDPVLSDMWRYVWYRELLVALVLLHDSLDGGLENPDAPQYAQRVAERYWRRALERVAIREGHEFDASTVGAKRIGPRTWVHRAYVADHFPSLGRAERVLKEAHPDHNWVVARHDRSDGSFAFIDSPDFDTAPEPIVGDSVLVRADGSTRLTRQAADPQIWHHKHLFVGDDYDGFDVAASRARSAEWEPHVSADERRRMGRRSVWEKMRPRWEGTTGAPPLRERVPEELRWHVRETTYRGDPIDLMRGDPGPVTTSRLSAPDTLEGLQRRIAGLSSTRTKVLAGYIAARMVFPLYTDLYGADLDPNNAWVWPPGLIDRIRSQFTREFDAETSTDVIRGWLEAPIAALEATRASLDGRLPDPSDVDVSRLSRLVSAVWHLAQVSVHHLPWGWVPPLGWRPSPEVSTPERAAAFAVSAVYFALHGMLRFYTGGRGDDTLSSPLGTGNQLITGAVHYAAMAAEANAGPEGSRWAYRRFITRWQHNVLRAIPVREGLRVKMEG